jgi:hypothetical protein
MRPSPGHTQFWRWFDENKDRLRADVYGATPAIRDRALSELEDAVGKAQSGVRLELDGPAEAQPRRLIVSADGKPEHVDAVKELAASAPAMAGWEVVAFRPRLATDDLAIELQGERVAPDDVWFEVAEGADGLAVTLHVRGLTRANERLRGLGASLLAEHSVGERDTLTLLESLDVKALPSAGASGGGWLSRLFRARPESPAPTPESLGLRPIRELARVFEEAKARKYPPPGSLTIDLEKDWHVGQGMIDGAPTLVRLHAGLGPVAGHPAYDQRLTVTVHFNEAGPEGLGGSKEEYEAVNDLTDRLVEPLQEGQESLVALILTARGRREVVCYTCNAESALRRVEAFRAQQQSHRIEHAVERDTYWVMYRNYLQAGKKPSRS